MTHCLPHTPATKRWSELPPTRLLRPAGEKTQTDFPMKRVRGNTLHLFASCCMLAACAAGCAHSAAPAPPSAADEAAAEQARREERLKIMQEYWQEHTAAGEKDPGLADPPPLEYPAGAYSGINFGPRVAPDPSLAEPNR